MAKSAVLYAEKERCHELDDEEVIDIISREVKKRRDDKAEYERLGRNDIAEDLAYEIDILLGYLPQQLSVEEIEQIVRQTITEVGANSLKDMGRVMKTVVPKVRGRADGKIVNTIAKKLLE